MSESASQRSGEAIKGARARPVWRYRHDLIMRLTHWVIAGAVLVLLMSGLQIFNAHPALYWGMASDFDAPIFAIDPLTGTNTVFGLQWPNTLTPSQTALPGWMTLPERRSLPEGRQWHFLFAWVLVASLALAWLWGFVTRRYWRNMIPHAVDLRSVPASIGAHLRLRLHRAGGRYNPLQKISYSLILFLIFPLVILTGLTMSPAMNAAWPFLVDLFGGRQSARTLHFACAMALVLFVLVHVVMALLSGPINAVLSITTGWRRERAREDDDERA